MSSSVCANPRRVCTAASSREAAAVRGHSRPRRAGWERRPAPGLEEQLRDRHEAEIDSTSPRSHISSYTYYIIPSSRAALVVHQKKTHMLMWEPWSRQHVPNLAVYIGRCHVRRRVKDCKSTRQLHYRWCGSVLTCQGPDFSSLRNVEKWRCFCSTSTKWWWRTIRVRDLWRRQPKNTIMWYFLRQLVQTKHYFFLEVGLRGVREVFIA